MPTSPSETLVCHYHYDPLDRLTDCTPFKQAGIQRFYCKTRLATEIQDTVQSSIFQHDDQLLAQQQSQSGKLDTTLLATDQQRSILNVLANTRPHPLAYTPYGHRPPENGLLSLLGFNGERPDPVTGHYHLGNGFRQFNPLLMRFNSPDSWSPFGEGGLNAYAYCAGDPVNRRDPTGHWILQSVFYGITFIGVGANIATSFIKDRDTATILRYVGTALVITGVLGRVGMSNIPHRLLPTRRPLPNLNSSARNSSGSMGPRPSSYRDGTEMQNLTAPRSPTIQNPANRTPTTQGSLGDNRHPQDDAQLGASVHRPPSNSNASTPSSTVEPLSTGRNQIRR